jgi:hypothetical protein
MAYRRLVNTMWVWGRRYMRVGASIGLILAYPMAVTVPHFLINLIISPIYGAVIGTVLGSVVGALHFWMKPRSREQSGALGREPPSTHSDAASTVIQDA